MAQATAVVIAASSTVTVTGNGAAVDLGTQTALALTVSCTGFVEVDDDPVPGVVVDIETAASDSGPWAVAVSAAISAVGEAAISASGLSRYVRAKWTLTNMTSVTFSVAGFAHTVYADLADLTRYAVSSLAIADMTTTQRADALIGASDLADGFLAAAYEMPITAWGSDLRKAVAELASAALFRVRGADPAGPDALVFDAESKALKWLDRIADGRLKPPAIVDQTPAATEGGSFVYTATKRGW